MLDFLKESEKDESLFSDKNASPNRGMQKSGSNTAINLIKTNSKKDKEKEKDKDKKKDKKEKEKETPRKRNPLSNLRISDVRPLHVNSLIPIDFFTSLFSRTKTRPH